MLVMRLRLVTVEEILLEPRNVEELGLVEIDELDELAGMLRLADEIELVDDDGLGTRLELVDPVLVSGVEPAERPTLVRELDLNVRPELVAMPELLLEAVVVIRVDPKLIAGGVYPEYVP